MLDRNDTDALLAASRGRDAVIDTVAFDVGHGAQLARLAGDVGSLIVVSTGAVYAVRDTTGEGRDGDQFPDYPVPITEDWPTLSGDGEDYGSKKAALEHLLLGVDDLPVSILRPGTLHGPFSTSLHHWSFIKRALDGRAYTVLAFDGESRFSTSASANVAELMRLCAENPAKRVLNAADDDALTVAEIGRKVFDAMSHDAAIVTFAGPPREDRVGFNPWGIPKPVVLGMEKARRELGYRQAISYDDAVRADIDWAVEAVTAAERHGRTWKDVFPGVIERYGEQGWFPYEAEDAYLVSLLADARVGAGR
ncbi:NAD(P)H-binding protein [Okibacterium endophyticum]